MSELVLAGNEVEQTHRLRELRKWVQDAGPTDAAELAANAKKARDVIKALKASLDLAAEATRLEMAALRRLGELNRTDLLPRGSNLKTAARWLADLSPDTFSQLLVDLEPGQTTFSVYRQHMRSREEEEDRQRMANIGAGRPQRPVRGYDGPSQLEIARAAETILESLTLRADTFTVSEAADELAEALEIPSWNRPTHLGLEQIVRDAISQTPMRGSEDFPYSAPQFVTYHEADVGWVRVPWERASLTQLRFMAEYRKEQADQMVGAWKELQDLLARLDDVAEKHPGTESCLELMERASVTPKRSAA
jgi:hypothetical protein